MRDTNSKTTPGGYHFNNRDRFSKLGKHFEPYAIKTYLGYVLMGGNKRLNTSVNSNLTQTFNVARFGEIENYGTVPKHDDRIMTKDEKGLLIFYRALFRLKEESAKLGSYGGRIV